MQTIVRDFVTLAWITFAALYSDQTVPDATDTNVCMSR